jgi:hypothetical protein
MHIRIIRPEDYTEFLKEGRVADCDCKLIQCVCLEARKHQKDCGYRVALTCAISVACKEHGLDVCPTCDPCICKEVI